MRLLTGPVLRLGARDVHALGRWARRLGTSPEPGLAAWQVPAVGIAECLTQPPPRGWLSDAAAARLTIASGWVADVRRRLHRPLPDVVADAVVVLGLDVETMARARRTGGVGVSHLDRLVDEAAQFAVYHHRFPGVDIKAQLLRHYPHDVKTTHVLGYVGRIEAVDPTLVSTLLAAGYVPVVATVAPDADADPVALGARHMFTSLQSHFKAASGHATLVKAPLATRTEVAVFQPQPAPLAAISRGLKPKSPAPRNS